MSGTLAAAQSSTCCCRAVIAPCNVENARAALLAENEDGIPAWDEVSASFEGSVITTSEYVCNGWTGATETTEYSIPTLYLKNQTSIPPFGGQFGNNGIQFAQDLNSPVFAGTVSYSTGMKAVPMVVNCCAGEIPGWACQSNGVPPCTRDYGMWVEEIGNPLGRTCSTSPGPSMHVCGQGIGCGWLDLWATSTISVIASGFALRAAFARIRFNAMGHSGFCGSIPVSAPRWELSLVLCGDQAACPNGTQFGGGCGGTLMWARPCCNPLEGPVGTYYPVAVPQSGTFIDQFGCRVTTVTSTFPQGTARVTRIQ